MTTQVQISKHWEGKKLNVLGDNQTAIFTAEATNKLLTTIMQNNPPGTQIPMHVHHNEDEAFHVLEGEIEFTAGGKTCVLTSGDSIFLPRHIPHTFKVVGTSNAKTILNILPGRLEPMFEELSQLPAGPPDFLQVSEICGRFGIHFL